MADAALIAAGRYLLVLRSDGTPTRSVALGADLSSAATRWSPPALAPPPELVAAIRAVPASAEWAVDPSWLAVALAPLGISRVSQDDRERRRWRERLPLPPASERAELLAFARAELERALRSPEQALIALSREETRVERAARKEANAAEAFVGPPDSSLARYAEEWADYRALQTAHHRSLEARVAELAREIAPNLASLLGPKVAARLVAAAGGVEALATLPASRLQLLGARRRPSGGHGPRYGLILLADRLGELREEEWGAMARSLASLAVIAARADAITHRPIAPELVRRRDRRIAELRRRAAR